MTEKKPLGFISPEQPTADREKICGAPAYENRGWRYRLPCHRMLVNSAPVVRTQPVALFKGRL